MPVLVKFDDCIARPEYDGKKYLLRDHLINVGRYARNCVGNQESVLSELLGLAGICHDLLKADSDWQSYIRGEIKKGPSHAPGGAFLFSMLAYDYLIQNNCWDEYKSHWLRLTRDIADHHGRLKNLDSENWMKVIDTDKLDLDGINSFLHENHELIEPLSKGKIRSWPARLYDLHEDVLDVLDASFESGGFSSQMQSLQLWRKFTNRLIAGDRLDITPTETTILGPEKMLECQNNLEGFLASSPITPLSDIRMQAQVEILRQLSEKEDKFFFTLEMPTGYGKTIASLKLATYLGRKQGYSKIFYVAPYISILEQTSKVIENTLGEYVLESHSLAINNECDEMETPKSQLFVESWANSIICTSFQQWSKMMLPKRAQDLLRRTFIKDSIVIIDEPQIFDPKGWNLFLCSLDAMVREYNLKVIFLSATMPPFSYGLSEIPVKLSIVAQNNSDRYIVRNEGRMDENEVADFILNRPEQVKAGIFNTIEDAYLVYKNIFDMSSDDEVLMIQGMMFPLHKNILINKIKRELASKREKGLIVISTQVLEAGVDVSFEHLTRALPILPSLVQAAGRVNRSHEKEEGVLSLVSFYRGGEKDTRSSIYEKGLQKITDKLLGEKDMWRESEMMNLVDSYYKLMFKRNSYETSKQSISDAYEGYWEQLANYKPFGEEYPRLPVFIPWDIPESYYEYLPDKFIMLKEEFDLDSAEKIYSRYEDHDYMKALGFEKKKRFMILFNHFVINVPIKLAIKIADKDKYLSNKIPSLLNYDEYTWETGLAKRKIEGFDTII